LYTFGVLIGVSPVLRIAGGCAVRNTRGDAGAAELGVPRSVIYRWQRSGYLVIRQRAGEQSAWIIWADAEEVQRLRQLRGFEESHRCQRPPAKLTTPIRTPTRPKVGSGSSSASKGGK
jgi:hypothetical protein